MASKKSINIYILEYYMAVRIAQIFTFFAN